MEKHLTNDFLIDIIDEFEDWFDIKGIRIPNEDRDIEVPDGGGNIWGADFDYIMNMLRDVCERYGITVDDRWEH